MAGTNSDTSAHITIICIRDRRASDRHQTDRLVRPTAKQARGRKKVPRLTLTVRQQAIRQLHLLNDDPHYGWAVQAWGVEIASWTGKRSKCEL